MIDRNLLKQGFQEWFQRFNCNVYLIITFRKAMSLEVAKNKFKQFFKYINKKGDRFHDKPLHFFAYFDKNPGEPGFHIHVVLGHIPSDKWELLRKLCLQEFGFTRVKDVHSGVIPYFMKKHNSSALLDNFMFGKIRNHDKKPLPTKIFSSSSTNEQGLIDKAQYFI